MIGPGVSLLRNGELHLIDNQGFPGRAIDPWDIYKNVTELRGAYSSYILRGGKHKDIPTFEA